MVTAEYFLFCESKAYGDAGQLSLHNIFDKVYAGKFPTNQHPFVVVFRLAPKSKPMLNQTIDLVISSSRDGEEVNKLEARVEGLTIELGSGAILSFNLNQFVFPEAGDYDFKLSVN